MNDVLLGVIIGSSITLIGQVITQVFQLRGEKWKKYQERLDLIFKERIEAYKVMNTHLFILAEAISKKENVDQVRKDVTSTWIERSVYFSPKVSDKILRVINDSAMLEADPDSQDKIRYMNSLKQAKLALQGLEDINWLPSNKNRISNSIMKWMDETPRWKSRILRMIGKRNSR
jgi:hypothetical protein